MIQVNHETMQELVARIGARLLNDYGRRPPTASREEMFERFYEANGWAESALRAALEIDYPDVQWSDAELDFDKQKNPEFRGAYWVPDMVDGGIHLHQGFAFWSISLCLIEDGEPVYSLVYDPYRRECFHAVRGAGAFLNGTPIEVSRKPAIRDALLATAPPAVIEEDPVTTEATVWSLGRLLPEAFAVRMLGSVALQLAYVACGRLDAYWEYGEQLYDWIAGALLVREAKGSVTDVNGKPFAWGALGIIAGCEPLRSAIEARLVR